MRIWYIVEKDPPYRIHYFPAKWIMRRQLEELHARGISAIWDIVTVNPNGHGIAGALNDATRLVEMHETASAREDLSNKLAAVGMRLADAIDNGNKRLEKRFAAIGAAIQSAASQIMGRR